MCVCVCGAAKRKSADALHELEAKNKGGVQQERARQKRREEAEQYSAFIATQYYYYLEV
jgi:hypothetical protein